MHPHQCITIGRHVTFNQHNVLTIIDQIAVDMDFETFAIMCLERSCCNLFDKLFRAATIGDQISYRSYLHSVPLGECDQVGQASHRPVLVHHLANHPCRNQPRQT